MAVKYPDILEHNNPNKALMDDNQLRGGFISVPDLSARLAFPLDKRKAGMVISYIDSGRVYSKRYNAILVDDTNWTLEANWSDVGKSEHIHNQDVNSDTWTIKHDLNSYPTVVVMDSGNTMIRGFETNYIDKNNVTLKFNIAFNGKAILN